MLAKGVGVVVELARNLFLKALRGTWDYGQNPSLPRLIK